MADEEDGMISNKKPRKAMMQKSMLYGCFVKVHTLSALHTRTIKSKILNTTINVFVHYSICSFKV